MTSRSPLTIVLCAALGLVLGLLAHRLQSPQVVMMNYFGVMAFASMGASLGCLMCQPLNNRH